VLSAGVLAGALLIPSSALAAEDPSSDRWIAVEDDFAAVLPDGQTFTDDDPPPEGQEDDVLPVGTRLFITEVLYETDDGTTRGEETGRTHIECTAQVRPDTVLCDIAFVLTDDHDSQLHGTVLLDSAAEDPNAALQFDIAVTGGTGAFAGASGVVNLLDMSDTADPNAETVTLYEADLD
jgi:hypothetical protein